MKTLAFEALWRVLTFLLVFVGFLALALTGEVHPVVITLFVIFWGYGLARSRAPRWWHPAMVNGITFLVLAVVVLVAIVSAFSAVVILLIYLGLYKCYALREPTDHLHALVLAFFMFVGCSIITNSITFVLFMLVFILLSTLELVCINVAAEANRATNAESLAEKEPRTLTSLKLNRRVLVRSILGASTLSLVVLILSFVLFFVIPHNTQQAFSQSLIRSPLLPEAKTGYDESITFGALEGLTPDESTVLDVRVEGLNPNAPLNLDHLRLRGAVLEYYDESGWKPKAAEQGFSSRLWREIRLPIPNAQSGIVLHQFMRQPREVTRRLFAAPYPFLFVLGDFGEMKLALDYPNGLRALGDMRSSSRNSTPLMTYEVYSYQPPEATLLLRAIHAKYAARFARINAQMPEIAMAPWEIASPGDLPENAAGDANLRMPSSERQRLTAFPATALSEKIRNLAGEVMTASDPPGKLLQLLQWLNANFQYTLKPQVPPSVHPIEYFLFRSQKGHCEYFATTYALMARTQGIPARVATGFYTTEKREAAGSEISFIVRQKDAHAWVEVWLEGWGWLTLDPTPPDLRGRGSFQDEKVGLFENLDEKLNLWWRVYVVGFSQMQQGQLYRVFFHSRPGHWLWKRIIRSLSTNNPFFHSDNSLSNESSGFSWTFVVVILVLLAVAVLVFGLLLARRISRRAGRQSPLHSPLPPINQLVRRLEAMGWKRIPSQTLAEFVGPIDAQTEERWQLTRLLDFLQRWRYAGDKPSLDQRARATESIRRIR